MVWVVWVAWMAGKTVVSWLVSEKVKMWWP